MLYEAFVMDGELSRIYIPHLKTQFEQGRPILFTGAGFSAASKNSLGENLPTGRQLREKLWPICFPDADFDPDTSLQDLYQYATTRHQKQLKELLLSTLTVVQDGLPTWYQSFFSLPWSRIYTLNVDDLELAVARAFDLPRKINSLSGAQAEIGGTGQSGDLDVIHLNGKLSDIPNAVTFSVTQYAQRLGSIDPLYRRLAAELLTCPCVFVGTALDEPSLWVHIEQRKVRGGGHDQREFRPRSYLVTKTLSPARQALLAEFNVVWLPMSAEEFQVEVIGCLGESVRVGLAHIAQEAIFSLRPRSVPEVGNLAQNPLQGATIFLVSSRFGRIFNPGALLNGMMTKLFGRWLRIE